MKEEEEKEGEREIESERESDRELSVSLNECDYESFPLVQHHVN